jgi:hypothetical protein
MLDVFDTCLRSNFVFININYNLYKNINVLKNNKFYGYCSYNKIKSKIYTYALEYGLEKNKIKIGNKKKNSVYLNKKKINEYKKKDILNIITNDIINKSQISETLYDINPKINEFEKINKVSEIRINKLIKNKTKFNEYSFFDILNSGHILTLNGGEFSSNKIENIAKLDYIRGLKKENIKEIDFENQSLIKIDWLGSYIYEKKNKEVLQILKLNNFNSIKKKKYKNTIKKKSSWKSLGSLKVKLFYNSEISKIYKKNICLIKKQNKNIILSTNKNSNMQNISGFLNFYCIKNLNNIINYTTLYNNGKNINSS